MIISSDVIMIDLTKKEKRKIAELMVKTSMGIGKKPVGNMNQFIFATTQPTPPARNLPSV